MREMPDAGAGAELRAFVDGYEGLRSLEVLIAGYRSARDGVRVGLPLVF